MVSRAEVKPLICAIAGKTFNAGYQNRTIADIAGIVRNVMADEFPEKAPPELVTVLSDDPRSYRISSEKIRRELNFVPRRSIEDAVHDLINAFKEGKLRDSMNDIRYYNIKTMQAIQLK